MAAAKEPEPASRGPLRMVTPYPTGTDTRTLTRKPQEIAPSI